MKVTKAVIPVAGKATRLFPASAAVPKGLFPLVGPDGVARSLLHMILRQGREGGIERFALVVSPGQQEQFDRYFRRHEEALAGQWGNQSRTEAEEIADLAGRVTYLLQPRPQGLGHAVWCAREFLAGEPFLVMLGDQLFLRMLQVPGCRPAIETLLRLFAELGGVSVTAAQPRPIEEAPLHGVLAGDLLMNKSGPHAIICRVTDVAEKPDPQTARKKFKWPQDDSCLTHAGAYAFSPEIMVVLDDLVRRAGDGETGLTAAQHTLVKSHSDYYAALLPDYISCDMGNPAGLVDTMGMCAGLAASLPIRP